MMSSKSAHHIKICRHTKVAHRRQRCPSQHAVVGAVVEHEAKQEVEENVSKRKVRRLSYIAGDCRELGSTTKPPSPADRIKQLYVGAGSSIPQDLR